MDLSVYKDKLDSYFDSEKEHEMLAMLEHVVNMDSFSADGKDVNKVGEYLTGWLRKAGFHTCKCDKPGPQENAEGTCGHGNVFKAGSHPSESGSGIVMLGHMDTVFPKGTAAARPFRIEGDRAMGPGVCDMKSGLVAGMFAARALKELGLISRPLTLVFSPDEELGSPTASPVYREEIADARCVLCLEPGIPLGGITTERKGSGHFHLTVRGKAAHAGVEYEKGASAILELAHKILAFDELLDLKAETTVNTGIVSGGTAPNCVAAHAEARIHFTFKDMEHGDRLLESCKKIMKRDFVEGTESTLTGGIRLYPLNPTPGNRKLYALAANAADALGMPAWEDRSKGAAETGFTSTVLGIPSLCGLGPEGWGFHSDAEYMLLPSFIPRCKLAALTALQAMKL